jgi:Uma2 family endonuclease
MATAIFTPVEEYLAKTWHPDREYVDGDVRERNLGEFDHADLQTALSTWLRNRWRQWNIRVCVEQRVQVSPTRYRIPDVSVVSGDQPKEQIITHPPLICIEVLSKDDTIRSLKERVADYAAMGVHNIWVFEPEGREVWVCTADSMTKLSGNTLTAAGTDIVVLLDEIWGDLQN